MREPISTLTNAAYVLAGILVGGIYGVALVALGIASGGFHATQDRRWQAADECMMYVVLCCLAVLWGVPPVIGYVGALALVVAWQRLDSFVMVPVLTAFVLLLIGVQVPLKGVTLALLGGAAFAIRQLAERAGGQTEDVGHGVWHVLTATALYLAVP
jgi:hypothetical protein